MKVAATFALCCTLPASSFALGFRIPDQDARATARGNAFAATADNPSAIYYNPAGITYLYPSSITEPATLSLDKDGKSKVAVEPERGGMLDGLRNRAGLYAITLETRVDPLAAGQDSFDIKRTVQYLPTAFYTYKLKDAPIVFGLGSYAPYGFGLEYPEDSPIRNLSISGGIQYLSINPVVAWQVSETFSIAAGATFNYARADLKRGIRAAHDRFQFAGDGWGTGWNAGLMWRPHEMHSFGVMYRSQTDVNFEGSVNTHFNSFSAGPVTVAGVDSSEPGSAGIKFPQHVVFGYSFRPTPKWNFEVNVDWTDWDNLNSVYLRKESGDVPLVFNWEASIIYGFGVSYSFDNGLVGSLGYVYSENSVPNESFSPAVPDSNRHIFSAGIGGKWGRWDVDLAYQYAHGPERDIRQGTAADGSYTFDAHAISLSVGYTF
jgi:long-chain fatty acid transport protein